MFEYPVLVKKEKGGFYVSFPDLPEAFTLGATEEEALAAASEALEAALSFYVEEGAALPRPSLARGRPVVGPSFKGALKLGLYHAMKTGGLRKADLARRLGCHPVQVDRLLDLCHSSRLEQLEAAYAALGQRVRVEAVALRPRTGVSRRKGPAKSRRKQPLRENLRRA